MARDAGVVLGEMLRAIDGILDALADRSLDDRRTTWLLRHGVERGIEIISEAAGHLPVDLTDGEPGIQ